LNLEGIDAAQMDGLGEVTDEILAAQMEIQDTMGADSEDDVPCSRG
jgi:hypothetical protein